MNWRTALKANKAMLLTLPGAALWSLPVGIVIWRRIQRHVPAMALPESLIHYAFYVVYVLVPTAAVCSFLAMELFSESRRNPGIAALLLVFNQITTVFASVGTLAIVVELAGQIVKWAS